MLRHSAGLSFRAMHVRMRACLWLSLGRQSGQSAFGQLVESREAEALEQAEDWTAQAGTTSHANLHSNQ